MGAPMVVAGIMAAGGLMSAWGQRKAAQQQAAMLRYNAALNELAAGQARIAAMAAGSEQAIRTNTILAAQKVGFAAAGAALGAGGSLEDVSWATGIWGRLDELRAQNNELKRAWGLETEAVGMRAEASGVLKAARWKFAGSLLSTAAESVSMYQTGTRQGWGR